MFGRPGTPITPNGLGEVISDNVPAAHTFAKIHDQLLDDAKKSVQTYLPLSDAQADLLLNLPTMPPAGLRAIERETRRSVNEGVDYIRNKVKGFFNGGSNDPQERTSCPR